MSDARRESLTVSVVVPVRDDAEELRTCLALLARQTHPPLEVVVVDNGSTDDSAAVARAAGARVVSEPRPGIPYAASTGYDAARGEVVARLDADSRPGPDWVAQVVAALVDGADAVTGPGRFHDVPVLLRGPAALAYLGAYFGLCWLALARPPLWGSSMAMRRELWLRVRDRVHRDADVHDDMDLSFVLDATTRVRYLRALRVDVSGRSLVGLRQWRRRMARGVTTVRLSWDEAPPWVHWQQRLRPVSPPRAGSAPG